MSPLAAAVRAKSSPIASVVDDSVSRTQAPKIGSVPIIIHTSGSSFCCQSSSAQCSESALRTSLQVPLMKPSPANWSARRTRQLPYANTAVRKTTPIPEATRRRRNRAIYPVHGGAAGRVS